MRKKLRKSTWMPLALLAYTTAMAAYFLPKNSEISDTEKWVTLTNLWKEITTLVQREIVLEHSV